MRFEISFLNERMLGSFRRRHIRIFVERAYFLLQIVMQAMLLVSCQNRIAFVFKLLNLALLRFQSCLSWCKIRIKNCDWQTLRNPNICLPRMLLKWYRLSPLSFNNIPWLVFVQSLPTDILRYATDCCLDRPNITHNWPLGLSTSTNHMSWWKLKCYLY